MAPGAVTFSLWSFMIYFIVLHNTPFHWLLAGSYKPVLGLVSGLAARITIFAFLSVPLVPKIKEDLIIFASSRWVRFTAWVCWRVLSEAGPPVPPLYTPIW